MLKQKKLCTCLPCAHAFPAGGTKVKPFVRSLLRVSHGMLQPAPAQCCALLRVVGLVQRCFCASLGPAYHIPVCTGVPGLCWPCPATPCAEDSRVRMGCAVGGSASLKEGKDLLLLAVGLFGAGPLVGQNFAVVEKWGFLGCKAGSCS